MRGAAACLVDGRPANRLAVDDRGLAYGDGLFETIRFVAGQAPLWAGHMARLARGAAGLALTSPPAATWLAEAARVAAGRDCVVKLVLTRGSGRGYAAGSAAGARRVVQRLPLPETAAALYQRGLRLRWCRLRLARQPALAGFKHLNRLEQVLARSEWRDPRIDEGLCLDTDGNVVCATAANLFLVRDGVLATPALDHCGVAGVARAFLLARARRRWPVQVRALRPADLQAADELFLCNAVRGVMPVRALGTRRWQPGPVTAALGYTLAARGIGLPPTLPRRNR
ncbi:MAG: aminodeoxychorismate lyase [Xanthomonadales bacterium]|nr:aminodeoxychorismate lyase [Xanthomonadales bacterium]